MTSENKKEHVHIAYFNPDVEVYNTTHQDLLLEFNAGKKFLDGIMAFIR